MPTSILQTRTCSSELRWFEESAPTSPPIHRWHLWITGSILSSAKWTCTSTTRSWRLRRILTRFAPTSIPYWITEPKRKILNSQASCGTRTPPDRWMPQPWMVAIQGWLNDKGTLRRVELSRWWGGYTSTSSSNTDFFSTVSVSR